MKKKYLARKKELGLLSESEFFDRVAQASGYVDPETVKRIYNGMLTVMYDEVRTRGAVRFPALCDFHLVFTKEKRIRNRHMNSTTVKPAFHQLRIAPIDAVREYFAEFSERNKGVPLDPGQRLED